jgi:hypothetical protein
MPRLPGRRGGDDPTNILLFASGQASTIKRFSLTVNPVPKDVHEVISSRLTKSQPWLGAKVKLDLARHKALKAHETLQLAQEKLKDLEQRRERSLEDVDQVRSEELEIALQGLEDSLRQNHQQRLYEKEQQWEEQKRQMKSEIEGELKRLREEFEAEGVSEEPPAKRAKLEGSLDIREETGDTSSKAEENKGHRGNGAEEEEDDSKLSYSKSQEVKVRQISLSSLRVFRCKDANCDVCQALQVKVSELKQAKLNLVWLLKNMVKADQKEESKEKMGDQN